MNRPALTTAGTVLGILLLLGGKAATSPTVLALSSSHAVAAGASGTVTGPVENTRYGPVQVSAVVTGGRISQVTAVQLPTGGTSGSIADYAAPVLQREALAAQGAGIHAVSGATYTSRGYASSLQAALDQLSPASSSAASTAAAGSAS
ncbi:MAG: FMN-binding protein [Nocardioides sp.]|nr:FMN-binding protein [Nocardioides sp.]